MVSKLDRFKKRMEPAKELYTRELLDFTRQYDCLGEMKLSEMPDIDTQEYIYSFENSNNSSQYMLDDICEEIYDHMRDFSKANGIEEFSNTVRIWL